MTRFRFSTAALGTSVAAWAMLADGFLVVQFFASGSAAPLAVMSPRTFDQIALTCLSCAIATVGIALSLIALARRETGWKVWMALA